jgi:hypothetical protein
MQKRSLILASMIFVGLLAFAGGVLAQTALYTAGDQVALYYLDQWVVGQVATVNPSDSGNFYDVTITVTVPEAGLKQLDVAQQEGVISPAEVQMAAGQPLYQVGDSVTVLNYGMEIEGKITEVVSNPNGFVYKVAQDVPCPEGADSCEAYTLVWDIAESNLALAGSPSATIETEQKMAAEKALAEELAALPAPAPAPATDTQACAVGPIDGISVAKALEAMASGLKDEDAQNAFFDAYQGLGAGYVKQADGSYREARIGRKVTNYQKIEADVTYADGTEEKAVNFDRILSIDEAIQQGVATNLYNLLCPVAQQQMVAEHNRVRQDAGVATPLSWDPELAAAAQAWADKLIAADKEGRTGIGCGMGNMHSCENVTENIANSSYPFSPAGAVRQLEAEKFYYDANGNCTLGTKVCGHYETIINPRLTKVGCGMARLLLTPTTYPLEHWVCQYR